MNLYQNIVFVGFVNVMFYRITASKVKVVGIPYMAIDGVLMSPTDNMYEIGLRLVREINHNSKKYANLDEYQYNVILITDDGKDDIDMSTAKKEDGLEVYALNSHFVGFDVIDKSTKEVYVSIRKTTDGRLTFISNTVYNSNMIDSIKLVEHHVREILSSDRVKMTWDFEEALLATLILTAMHSNKLLANKSDYSKDELREAHTIIFRLVTDLKKLVNKYRDENPTITGFQYLSKSGSLCYLTVIEQTYRALILGD